MPFVIAGMFLLGVLCLLNLLLTFGVLRRLREHGERLAQPPSLPEGMVEPSALVGHALSDFSAVATDGSTITAESLTGRPQLLGFFSAGCGPCHERLPGFVTTVRETPSYGALAVVTGGGQDAADLVEQLGDAATVVADEEAVVLATTLNISLYPTFVLLDPDGTVRSADTSVPALGRPAADALAGN